MNKKTLTVLVAIALLSLSHSASAAIMNAPVPSNAYITYGGLHWAWANPLPASHASFDLSYQSQFGWRLPTAQELLNAPLATDFLFAGANVPLGGTDPVSGALFHVPTATLTQDGAVAVPYFSNTYYHADWQDGLGEPLGPWAGMAGAYSLAEQLVVRVPVPGAVLLGMLGLSVAGVKLRKRS